MAETATSETQVQQSTNAEAGGDMLEVAAAILRTAKKEEEDATAAEKAKTGTTETTTDTDTDDTADESTETVEGKKKPVAETTTAAETTATTTVDAEYKEFDEDDTATEAEVVTGDGKKQVSSNSTYKPEDLSKLQEFDSLMADPLVKMVIEAKRSGQPIIPILESVRPVDFSKLSPEELIRKDCAILGITDEAAIKDELDSFNALTARKQKEELLQLQTKFANEQNTRIEKIGSDRKQAQEQQQAIMNNFVTEVKTMAQDAVGKSFYGITADEKTAKEMENYLLKDWGLFNKDGSINVKKAMSYAFWDLKGRKMLKEHHKNAKASGQGEILDDVNQPDKMNTSGQNRTSETKEVTPEKLVSAFVGRE